MHLLTRPHIASKIFTLLVFFICLGLFWYHAAPSVSFHDSGEFVTAAATGGLPHPPGAPIWTLGATLFLKVFGFTDPAYGCNLYAGLWGAITLALLYLVSLRVLRQYFMSDSPWQTYVIALLPSAILLGSSSFIEQSLIVEQYTMLTAFMTLLLLLLTWIQTWDAPAHELIRKLRWIGLGIGLTWGLAISNHLSQICLAVPIGVYIVMVAIKINFRVATQTTLFAFAGLLIGLLPFLYLPYVAHKKPLFDAVKADTFEQFLWAIQRKSWGRRSIAEAPDFFTSEWVKTYDLIGELGIIGFLLFLGGIVFSVFKRWTPALWLTLMALPFSIGLYYGHLTQANIDIKYIRYYGLKDWHIPLYLWGAFIALSLVGYIIRHHDKLRGCMVLLVILVCGRSLWVVHENSLRTWAAPQEFVADVKSGMQSDSNIIVLPNGDNVAYMLMYDFYLVNPESNKNLFNPGVVSPPVLSSAEDFSSYTLNYLSRVVKSRAQPIRASVDFTLSSDINVYYDFVKSDYALSSALLPAGFLFKLSDSIGITSQSIRKAEGEWRKTHAQSLRVPGLHPHRLEREAYGMIYWQRGEFFFQHGVYDLAVEEYIRSLRWMPDNGYCWLKLGLTYQQWDNANQKDKALIAYESAIQSMDFLYEAHFRMGTLLINEGKIPEGITHLEKCLALNPDHIDAKANLDYARAFIKQ